ncbi:hypothetical protein JR316_0002022 [Psilocybe cubensis]|uniref:Uncharacterized protein n=2 Tax=Psilocybe cubensis TaxID=181762 RepID=A0A8H7Y7V4_PSICU|nr:hypothetical protein JR316_0002022 [Psilocybe cubensis]KAH9485115.1 hypothetical protein JR316_0002022 [Psilocybe cubensis]
MSGPSYRLQAPRPRRPPSPLNFDNSFKPTSVVSTFHDSQTLLYDLPSTVSMSPPPTSPRSGGRVISPTSPSFPGRSSRGPRNGRPTPPPSSRNRSATPLGVAPSELESFAEYCRAWYYCQDDNSGRLMTQTLATLPPSQRAPFSRLQASIRSAYHRSVNARRHAEFQAHLSATTPGGSLMPHARADPRSKAAQKERYERAERFMRNWCNTGMPGTKPFFEALWAVMRLQVIPENLGGAGKFRIEWEFDDAVFKEAAGKDFMLEAIDFLKGVLAFEETPSIKISNTSYGHRKDLSLPALHSRAQSHPSPSHQKAIDPASTVQPKRARAPSDPFLDAPQSRTLGPASHSPNAESILTSAGTDGEEPPSPVAADGDTATSPFLQEEDTFDNADEQYLRIWTSPDLTNPELLQLLELFPSFVSRRPLPRFPVSPTRHVDVEEGEDDGLEGRQIRFGTGSMWVSSKERGDSWEGGWWTKFIMWWRRIFC